MALSLDFSRPIYKRKPVITQEDIDALRGEVASLEPIDLEPLEPPPLTPDEEAGAQIDFEAQPPAGVDLEERPYTAYRGEPIVGLPDIGGAVGEAARRVPSALREIIESLGRVTAPEGAPSPEGRGYGGLPQQPEPPYSVGGYEPEPLQSFGESLQRGLGETGADIIGRTEGIVGPIRQAREEYFRQAKRNFPTGLPPQLQPSPEETERLFEETPLIGGALETLIDPLNAVPGIGFAPGPRAAAAAITRSTSRGAGALTRQAGDVLASERGSAGIPPLGNLPENVLIQFPSGKWGFVGKVDARLMYVTKEGAMPTEAQFGAASQAGPRIAGLRTRVWDTKEEAVTAAAELQGAAKASTLAETTPVPLPSQMTFDELTRQKIATLETKRFKSHGDEISLERLKKQLATDPAKWSVGQGVGWRAVPGQINRGYRIESIIPETKEAIIRPVGDIGVLADYTSAAQRVDLQDLLRDKKYDVPAPAAVVEARKAAKEPWEMTRDEWQRSGMLANVGESPVPGTYSIKPEYISEETKRLREQWFAYERVKNNRGMNLTMPKLLDSRRADFLRATAAHEEAVQKALSEGKPVPPEVLADYPDLAGAGKATEGLPDSGVARKGMKYRSFDRPSEALGRDVSSASDPFAYGSAYEIEFPPRGAQTQLPGKPTGQTRGPVLDGTEVTRVFVEPEYWVPDVRTVRLTTDIPQLKEMFPNAEFVEVRRLPTDPDNPIVVGPFRLPDTQMVASEARPPADLSTRLEKLASPDEIDEQLARSAYRWVSQDPERRALQARQDYADYLNRLQDELMEGVHPGKADGLAAQLRLFKEGYRKRYEAWITAEGKTANPMVTGPARFNVARNQKAMALSDKRREELTVFREQGEARLRRQFNIKEKLTPEQEAAQSNKIKSAAEVNIGDRVYSLMTRRYGVVERKFPASVRLRLEEPLLGQDTMTEKAGALQWLSYDDLQIKLKAATAPETSPPAPGTVQAATVPEIIPEAPTGAGAKPLTFQEEMDASIKAQIARAKAKATPEELAAEQEIKGALNPAGAARAVEPPIPPVEPPRPPVPPEPPAGAGVPPPSDPLMPSQAPANPVGFRDIVPGLTRPQALQNRFRGVLRQPEYNELATPAMGERSRAMRTVDSQAQTVGSEAGARVADTFTFDKQGRIIALADAEFPKGPTIQDVAARLPRYVDSLTPEQQATLTWLRDTIGPYRQQWDEVQEIAGDLADRKAVELGSRADIMDGGFYLPRGRADIAGADEPIKVSVGRGVAGGSGGFKKAATLDSMAQGVDLGYEYPKLSDALTSYVKQIGRDIVDRSTANYFLELKDAVGVRIAQTAADRVDPLLRKDVEKLLARIASKRTTTIRRETEARVGNASRFTTEQTRRLQGPYEKLADKPFEQFMAAAANKSTDSLFRDAEQWLIALARGKANIAKGELDAMHIQLFDLRGRLKRAQDVAKNTPRDRGTIGMVQLTGYDFPDALANAANEVLKAEQREMNPTLFAQTVNVLNGIYRSVTSTLDDSAVAIQGLLGWYKNPRASARALQTNRKAFTQPEAWGRFLQKFNEESVGQGMPDAAEWTRHNLRQAGHAEEFAPGAGLGERAQEIIRKAGIKGVKPLEVADRIFAAYGDSLRLTWAQSELADAMRRGNLSLPEVKRPGGEMDRIAAAINGATGYSSSKFTGELGDMLLYAPRYFQARIETVGRGIAGIRPGAPLEQRIARDSLARMMAYGTLITFAANAALGNETDIRPVIPDGHGGWKRNSNFMRIRYGDRDWSVFGTYDSLLGLVLTTATGKGDQAFRQFTTSALMKGLWDMWTGETVAGKRTRDTSDQVLRYLAESFQPFQGKETVAGVLQAGQAILESNPTKAAVAVSSTLGTFLGGKASPLSYSDIQGQIVKEIIKDNPEYTSDTTYADLSQADKRRVNDDPRLKEMAQKFEDAPIPDETLVEMATESLAAKRQALEVELATRIAAGATGEALRELIQDFKRDRFTASSTVYNEKTTAALDRLRTKGKTPLKDVLAQRYLDVPMPYDRNGEPDYEAFGEAREAVLREADSAGVDREYLTGHGPNSFRVERFSDPKVRAAVEEYEKDMETLKPYWETADLLQSQKLAYAKAVEQRNAFADKSPEQKEFERTDLLWRMYKQALEAAHDDLKGVTSGRKTDIFKAGAKWGYWGPELKKVGPQPPKPPVQPLPPLAPVRPVAPEAVPVAVATPPPIAPRQPVPAGGQFRRGY